MNILIVTNMFPPITTGSSHYAEDLAMVLHERGHNVTVVTVMLDIETPKDTHCPFNVIRLSSIHLKLKGFNWFTATSHNPINYFRLAGLIKKYDIDVVHQINHYLDTAIVTRVVCGLMNIPYVVSIHTQLQFRPKIYTPVLRFLDKIISGHLVLRGSSKIIALDSEVVRYLNDTYGGWLRKGKHNDKVVIIPHGIVIDNSRFPVKTNYELSHTIISIGHVVNVRNRLNLIKAMKVVVSEFPNMKLEIIGHVYTKEPHKLIKELGLEKNVYLTGEKTHTDTINKLKEADIHAVWLNLNYVGMGTAVQESMLCGVPVINNSPENLYGDTELKNMRDIVLIDQNNVQEIADKIILLVKNKELRKSIGENGRSYIIKNLDINIIAGRIENVYLSLAREKG